MLNGAIKLVCDNYKSAFFNLKKGNIRYSKMIDIEKCYFNGSTIFLSTIGNVKFKYDSKLMYDKLKNKYYLFIPIEIEKIKEEKPNNVIAINPGVTNFINGILESSLIRVGEDVNKKMKDRLYIR